jgi:hypothetical protein
LSAAAGERGRMGRCKLLVELGYGLVAERGEAAN